MRIEQERLTAEFIQKIIDLSHILINIASALDEAAFHLLGLTRYAFETG
jgi:hypothetical protein